MENFFVAIRDDDTSFWTKPEELEQLYGWFFERGGKVSLAVIPYSWKQINPGMDKDFYIDRSSGRRFIYENKALVDYLHDKIKENRIEIMQHGYDHVYGVKYNGKIEFLDKNVREELRDYKNYCYLPECLYKSSLELEKDLKEGKEILEDTFKVKVKIFVPPGNAISKESVKIVAKIGLHISGIMEKSMNRPINVRTLINYGKRIYWKLKYNLPYPFVMDYGTHKELVAYALTPSTDLDWFYRVFKFCREVRAPFVLATHYWEILRDNKLKKNFYSFLEKLENNRILLLHQLMNNGS